ncbi:hypothetical protein ACJ6WE_09025 [Streptomyces sp. MMS24-I31]|uniref:hypothetical protein n=1 Tax=Streptomyces sp. MMS24-I31 TaxID=3351563 RepID=UPI003896BA8E
MTSQPDPQLIADVEAIYHGPTSFRDDTEPPKYGPTPPVLQPDSRIVPSWAAGIAVASIGVGAGITGIGCGAWLVLKGLASVTLNSVLMVTLPIAALAMLATAIGAAINRARPAITTNIYKGTVHQKTVHSKNTGLWAKTNNQQ